MATFGLTVFSVVGLHTMEVRIVPANEEVLSGREVMYYGYLLPNQRE